MELIQDYILYILSVMAITIIALFIMSVVLFVKTSRQKKKYDFFMGANRRPSHNLEMKIEKYYEVSKGIDEKYTKLLDMVEDMDKTMKTNIQKVGLVRYNPFDEMGGNLCFALALLDSEDNGVVINGIHSRTGSFTYAKPIQMGVSTYILSDEEIKAVEIAKEKAYVPEHEKVVKVKFKPTFRRRDKEPVMESQISLGIDDAGEELGDVTSEEKAQIMQEEIIANMIAHSALKNEDTDTDEEEASEDEFKNDMIQEEPVFIKKLPETDEE